MREGVSALAESRFVYTQPCGGLGVALAGLYVRRRKWGPLVIGVILALAIGLAGYFFAYLPYQKAQSEAARIELAQGLPAQMDSLYNTIYNETKVQVAVNQAEEIRKRGKIAASEGDRPGAEKAVADLTALRDTIREEYVLQVVNQPDEKSGFWTFPEINTEATNYYIVVQALAPDGKALTLPIKNEESGETEEVSKFAVRVPQSVYDAVAEDKRDDGIIEHNVVGVKQYGFLDIDYVVPTSGGV